MKKEFILDVANLKELNKDELISIYGGHNGLAYKIGYIIGETVKKAAEILGVVGRFFE